MYAYKCITSYDGTRYNGWQKQGNTSNTIQNKLETTISKLLDEPITVHGSGRTDAGVHALGQVFHFHCEHPASDMFLSELNQYLPKDIRILSVEKCNLRFHARLNAKKKTYQYRIDTSPFGNPFIRTFSHHIATPLDITAIKRAAALIEGTHDFKSFCSNKRMKKSTIRTIEQAHIEWNPEQNLLFFTFTGDGFLYNMVRILSGTLIEVGLCLRQPEELSDMLLACDRKSAGHTAPAQGLFLINVCYEDICHDRSSSSNCS